MMPAGPRAEGPHHPHRRPADGAGLRDHRGGAGRHARDLADRPPALRRLSAWSMPPRRPSTTDAARIPALERRTGDGSQMERARVDQQTKRDLKAADTGTWASIKETLKVGGQALLIALVVRTLLFQPFNIPSGSLVPTLLIGDYLFVSKYSYGYSKYSLPLERVPALHGRRPDLGGRARSAATSRCSSCPRTTPPTTSSASSACPATRSR